MSNKALRTATFGALLAGATALSGCSSLGGLGFDRTATSSVGASAQVENNQTIPRTLSAPTQVAANSFVPPNDIGGGPGVTVLGPAMTPQPTSSVMSEDLPVLSSSANGTQQMMPAAQPLNPVVTPAAVAAPASNLVSVPSDAYVHQIASGESLYTIARRYNVTAQAIIQANGFSSPDKIYVGQKIVIPGRADQLAKMGPTQVASTEPAATVPVAPAAPAAIAPVAKPANELATLQQTVKPLAPAKQPEPVQQASIAPSQQPLAPKAEPVMSGADKFRWPISGRVITDFANSKGTGINIEAAEGAAVRSAEGGQVIYAGSGVEGYGNLILIRHPNGYVSAYAHLKDMNVAKGAIVSRGDNIGTAGKTGSVSKPQLHFELRKGATPVDPIPLLAS
jgi:murein DD-endopeptidase MepM/ murein hydrolase activator NlpD